MNTPHDQHGRGFRHPQRRVQLHERAARRPITGVLRPGSSLLDHLRPSMRQATWLHNAPHHETRSRASIRIEHDYRELKTGLGLDHFEGRSFTGWHRHVTLTVLAQAFCTMLRLDPQLGPKAAAPA